MGYQSFYDSFVESVGDFCKGMSEYGIGPAASFIAHFVTDLWYTKGVFAGVYEMEETMESITISGGADAISQLLFMAASAGIDFLESCFMLTLLPFISGCGHHGKMFGDGSMKAAMTIPESVPVIQYRTDNGNLVSNAAELYSGASGGENVVGEIYSYLKSIAQRAFSRYGAKILGLPEVISELVVGFIIGHIILKGIVDPCVIIAHGMKGISLCDGPATGWKSCYVGGFTVLPEAVFGPTSLPVTLMLSFNPWFSFLMFGEDKLKKLIGKALVSLLFSQVSGMRGVYRGFLRATIPLIWTIAGAFMFLVRSVTIVPLHKDISGADISLFKIIDALSFINKIRGFTSILG